MNRRERRASASTSRRVRTAAPALESPAAELHRAITAAERSAAAPPLARRQPERLYEAVDEAFAQGAAQMTRNPTSPAALACRQGCSFCCHRPVGTNAASVLHIAAWLRSRLSPGELEEVRARVAALDDKTHGSTWTLHDRPPYACAFLVDGSCSVYEVRPLVCRAWNSASADACELGLRQDFVEMPFDLFQRTVFGAVERGLQLAASDAGLDGRDLEFTAAIRIALQREDACKAWLDGEPVFEGCEAKPPPAARRRLPFAP
jgi:hypothetical protein